jgi:hypothetical protein
VTLFNCGSRVKLMLQIQLGTTLVPFGIETTIE